MSVKIQGSSGYIANVDVDGKLKVDATITLPTGAATEAKQDVGNTSLASIDTKTPALGQALESGSVPVVLPDTQITALTPPTSVGITGTADVNVTNASLAVTGTFFQATQPVSATNLDIRDLVFATDTVDVSGSSVSVSNFPSVQSVDDNGGSLTVDGTVSISGSVAVTGPLTDTQLRASAVPVSLTSTTITGSIIVEQPVGSDLHTVVDSGTITSITNVVSVNDNGGSLTVDGTVTANAGTGTFAVSAASLPLPSGASTSSLQTTGNTSLSSIDTKTPALGQALAAASVPVVLTAAQLSTLTPLSTVSVSNFPATQAVSAVSLPLPSGASTSALQTTGNTSLSSIDTKIPSNLTVTSTRLLVDPSGVTSPISAVSLPLPTGAATSSLQTTGNSSLSSIDTKTLAAGQAVMAASSPVVIASNQTAIPITDNSGSITVDGTVAISGSVAVTGPLTDVQLRASAVPVSLTSTTVTGNVDVTPSSPIATDYLPVRLTDGSGFVSVGGGTQYVEDTASTGGEQLTLAGTVRQDTPSTSTTTDGDYANLKTDSLGRLWVNNSGITQPISASSLPLPTGAATAALQTQPGVDIGDVTINNTSGAGAVNIQDGGNSITVDGTVGATQSGTWNINSISTSITPGVAAANLGKAADDASTSTGTGVAVLGIRRDTNTSVVSADGDYINLSTDRYGRTKVVAYESEVVPLGVYYYSSTAFLIQAAADAATAGRFWLINPVGSAVTVKVKRIIFQSQLGSALVAVTSPRITVERVTFTGTASGGTITPARRKTSDAVNVSSLRTASTGLTLTAGAEVTSFLPVASATAVSYNTPAFSINDPVAESEIELAAGGGLVIRQADAGTAADTRRCTINFIVMEY